MGERAAAGFCVSAHGGSPRSAPGQAGRGGRVVGTVLPVGTLRRRGRAPVQGRTHGVCWHSLFSHVAARQPGLSGSVLVPKPPPELLGLGSSSLRNGGPEAVGGPVQEGPGRASWFSLTSPSQQAAPDRRTDVQTHSLGSFRFWAARAQGWARSGLHLLLRAQPQLQPWRQGLRARPSLQLGLRPALRVVFSPSPAAALQLNFF